ncbi:MAG: alkaline phosphatase family protein [Rikenella sp.]|nr:alkaline phosphatase family protein [Rikenella sp.]
MTCRQLFSLLIPLSGWMLFGNPVAACGAEIESAISRHKPRLVVQIVVSQMRYDYLLRFADNFGEKGFHTLVREGSLCKRAMYDYALTRTGSGLATLSTGTNPAMHGVVGERWFNYTTGEEIALAADKKAFTVGSDEYDGQYSPRGLMAGTVGDQLKSAYRDSKVVSVALDPVSAVVMGGHAADAVYWLNGKNGHWVTSNYYASELPAWVRKFNDDGAVAGYSSQKWEISRPLKSYRNEEYTDISVDSTRGISFDFLTRKRYDYDRLRSSPAGNALVRDFAVQAIIYEGLGNDDAPDMLNIVFDASRHIGEKYGTGSIELEDSYYRLDEELATLLDFLETQVGRDRLLVVLTSDHGASDPIRADSRMPAGLFDNGQFAAIIAGFLGAQLGPGDWLLKFDNRQIYLNRSLIYQKGHRLEDIQDQVANFAIQFSGVSQAVTATALRNGHFAQGVMGRMQNSFFPRNSGDVVINLMPGWIEFSDGKLSDSGSPYNYDTHVPLLWFGGVVGTADVERVVNLSDVAPTIADILGIAPPPAATGNPIPEILLSK